MLPQLISTVRPIHHVDTLSGYLQSQHYWFKSNTALHFLPGSHTVSSSSSVSIRNIKNFSMLSTSTPPVQIQCNGVLEFCFTNTTNVYISSIAFIACGMTTTLKTRSCYRQIKYAAKSGVYSNTALGLYGIRDLVLKDVQILDSNGYGILAVDIQGRSSIVGCKFHNNNWRQSHVNGGNALFVFSKPFTNLSISYSNFSNGANIDNAIYQSGSGGLGIIFYQDELNSLRLGSTSIFISGCRFSNNRAVRGGNMFIAAYMGRIYRAEHNIYLKNCIFSKGEALLMGGAVYIESVRQGQRNYVRRYNQEVALHVTESSFIHNVAMIQGGALFFKSPLLRLYISINTSYLCNNHANTGAGVYGMLEENVVAVTVKITESRFMNNTAITGGGTYFALYGGVRSSNNITIDACNFIQNYATFGSGIIIRVHSSDTRNHGANYIHFSHNNFTDNAALEPDYNSAVLHLENSEFQLTSCNFTNNNSSGIYALFATIYLQGSIRFIGNRAVTGGAFHMDCSSKGQSVLRFNNINLVISNNTVTEYGGAIVVAEHCSLYRYCFFDIVGEDEQKIRMTDNRARIAGNSIYGGSLESCIFENASGIVMYLTLNTFQEIFGKDNSRSPSEVSSSPYKVCFCSGASTGSECNTTHEKAIFPGQEFNIPAATTGQYGGASPAIVRTDLITSDNTTQLGPRQAVQCFGRECGELTYMITTTANHTQLQLYVETALGLRHTQSVINITFLPCPFGFQLNTDAPSKCDCAHHLQVSGVTCDITSQTIRRPASMWIGNYSGDPTLHRNCPFDYCKPVDATIGFSDQDDQCSFNRSRVLCGSCLPGLSTSLGSSKCLECSNIYLLLIIPFAVAGVVLLFLLLICNLTVSTGTINGLIFYANIVRKNHSIFFPAVHKAFITQILEVFIAWLNLDLGIETCFFNGMDTYTKTWLQFTFPVYIWILAGTTIYASRHSVTISKLTAKNAVPTLATLFLLSYAKLLHAIIAAISPITLVNKYESSLVWLLDGNIPYLEGRHIALFGMALLATVLYVVPFTLLVLLAPCLQAHSDYQLLRWINRLKPLVDAYEGPYNVSFRFWTGAMLLIRVILFTVFACNAVGDPRVNLLAIAIVLLGLSVALNMGVYKRCLVQLLEVFFISNLAAFSVSTLFLKASQASLRKQEILTDVMVGSAFIVFIIIMVYHFYQHIRETAVVRNLVACYRNVHSDHDNDIQNSQTATAFHPSVTVVELESFELSEQGFNSTELREPLLSNTPQ